MFDYHSFKMRLSVSPRYLADAESYNGDTQPHNRKILCLEVSFVADFLSDTNFDCQIRGEECNPKIQYYLNSCSFLDFKSFWYFFILSALSSLTWLFDSLGFSLGCGTKLEGTSIAISRCDESSSTVSVSPLVLHRWMTQSTTMIKLW